jgi:enhancing lycopene biosynthesis protein 2
MKKAFVLLSGCGNRDGSEIREAVFSLLALELCHIHPVCIAPKTPQARTINHWESLEESVPRNALIEAARIARGDVLPLDEVSVDEADMLVIPGGQGASNTLCTLEKDGEKATLLPSVEKLILDFYNEKKPIVAICISPILLALSLRGKASLKLTLGKEPKDLELLTKLGHAAASCDNDSYIVDNEHKIITTPAYMGTPSLPHIWKGIQQAITTAATLCL